jgi:peptidoglycan/xylan/chitin deacetylase (PgdA/CDA1 family)
MGLKAGDTPRKRAGWYLKVAAAFVCAAALPATIPSASAYFQEKSVHYSGLQGTKKLALTFDDGPTNQTDDVLNILKKNGVKATFFVLGRNVDYHPAAMERMSKEGHLIANHTVTHSRLGRRYVRNPELLLKEIGGAHQEIAPFLRTDQGLYFRAPYGFWKSEHADALNADPILKHYVGPIYWDIGGYTAIDEEGNASSSADWDCWRREWTADECATGYMREIRRKKGGVVLFHDVRMRTATMVEQMIPALIRDGYSFITLDQIPAYDKLKTPPDKPVGKPTS